VIIKDTKLYFLKLKKTIHFGAKNGSTYIDHHDKIKRENYLKRHIVNEDWNSINAGSLSAILLWGKSTNLNDNLNEYLKKFKISR
jgi:hypothetical protein